MYYNAMGKQAGEYDGTMKIAIAESADMLQWNRIENASKGKYPSNIIFAFSKSDPYINAAHPMVIRNGNSGYTMFFVAVRRNSLGKSSGESALMRAESQDGLNWELPTTVMVPGPVGTVDDGQIFCPRIITRSNGILLMMYTAGSYFEGKLRIAFAESIDQGMTWQRMGSLRSLRNGAVRWIPFATQAP